MKSQKRPMPWKVLTKLVKVETSWMTLIGERLQDSSLQEYEYWRVEKPDGVLVITVLDGKLILPVPMYRPGIGQFTLDFCGGRINKDHAPEDQIASIVQRELGIQSKNPFDKVVKITKKPWVIDSSFTNVRLHGFAVELSSTVSVDIERVGGTYPLTNSGIDALKEQLLCLQCRGVLLEWLTTQDIAA